MRRNSPVVGVLVGVLIVIVTAIAAALITTFVPSNTASALGAAMAGTATLVLALVTLPLLWLNRDMISETRAMAEATKASNETLREQLQREWRPIITTRGTFTLGVGWDYTSLKARNLGRGPAINCRALVQDGDDDKWLYSDLFDVPADGQPVDMSLDNRIENPDPPLTGATAGVRGERPVVILYEDAAATWYRSCPPSVVGELWSPLAAEQSSIEGGVTVYKNVPPWVPVYYRFVSGRPPMSFETPP